VSENNKNQKSQNIMGKDIDQVSTFVKWDHTEQINIQDLNAALEQVEDPTIYEINTGGDDHAVVICPSNFSQKQAQQYFEEYMRACGDVSDFGNC